MSQITPQMLKDVVSGFVRFIDRRHRNNEIYDSSLLPWPKELILDACLQRLKAEKNPLIRQTIADGLLCAAFYQDGVGAEALQNCRFDLFTVNIASLDESHLKRLRLTVTEHLPHLDSEKFIAMLSLVQAEFNRLNSTCEQIERQHESTGTALNNP
jgi:hypothetical protein